uniref:Uncharacterized protein n=1 Tax=Mola mola TaxID=94237 RepID=A0A3Q3WLX1_MOLML
SVNRLMATDAELKQWLTVEPKLAINSEVLLRAGKEEMLKLCSELEMVFSCCEAKRDRLKETKESLLQDTKVKIQKVKVYQEMLMECLADILEKHIPLPQNGSSVNKKKKSVTQGLDEDLISLNEILETPHDPYVTIENTFWPPYVEMLLRYGIAVRHQDNNFKIRLETFC